MTNRLCISVIFMDYGEERKFNYFAVDVHCNAKFSCQEDYQQSKEVLVFIVPLFRLERELVTNCCKNGNLTDCVFDRTSSQECLAAVRDFIIIL